ncbi:MAG TPA: Xaa-Pro peptidase family protein [Paenibacillaceae bacterium]
MSGITRDRVRYPIPDRELERRWKLLRAAMKEREIDCLILQNDNQFLGGYVRYFTDIPAHQYPTTVIFPADEEMTVIEHGARSGPPSAVDRGVRHKIGLPYIPTLNYTNSYAPEAAVKVVKDLKCKRVGFVGLGFVSAAFYQYFSEHLKGIEILDATDLVDEIKAVKSPDEIAFIRKAVAIHDYAASALPAIIRPGRYEYEIRNDIEKLLKDLGSEEQLIMMGSAPPGTATPQLLSFFHHRRVEPGDQVFVMIEVNGPGGYYAEIGRTWCLGEPSKELLDAWETALAAQKLVASMLKPGADPAELLKANNEFLESRGYAPEKRLFGHGQGYDLVERPAFVERETIRLKEGMFVAVHPLAANDKAYAFCCDNYLITADGAERVQKTPQDVFVIA